MSENYDDPNGPYCDRCKATTKASEWKFRPAPKREPRFSQMTKRMLDRVSPDHFEHVRLVEYDTGPDVCGKQVSVSRKI